MSSNHRQNVQASLTPYEYTTSYFPKAETVIPTILFEEKLLAIFTHHPNDKCIRNSGYV